MMNIYTIALIWLLLAVVCGYKKPAMSLPFLVSLQLLVPYSISFNVGVNLNIFNLSVLIFMLLSLRMIQKNKPVNSQIKTYLKGYFLYVCVYSFLVSFSTFTFGEYIQNMILFFFEYIGIAYCLNYVRFDDRSIKYFNIAIIVSSIVIIVYGIFNYIVKVNPYMLYINLVADIDVDYANEFMDEQRGFLDGRISSTFRHPLQLGQAALLLFCYILYGMQDKLNKVLYILILIGLIVMCVLCGSRSAIFPLLVPILFYLKNIKIHKKFLYAIVVFSVLSLAYINMPQNMQKTFKAMVFVWDENASSNADIKGSSVSGRADQYMSAINIVKDNLLLGLGKGYVAKYGHEHSEMYGYESIVLRELVDGGVCGLIVFVLFYLLVYRALLRGTRIPFERARIHSFCGSFLISSFLTGVSYSFFSLYMALCMILYYDILNNRKKIYV